VDSEIDVNLIPIWTPNCRTTSCRLCTTAVSIYSLLL